VKGNMAALKFSSKEEEEEEWNTLIRIGRLHKGVEGKTADGPLSIAPVGKRKF
jgi:hypothetical protein